MWHKSCYSITRCLTNCCYLFTDAIPTARRIFDSFIHPYQLYSIIISKDLRAFFNKNSNNSIIFWDCLSNIKWSSHLIVDKELKCLKINLILPCKFSWELNRKEEYDDIVYKW